jgi:hypothetical protein
MRTAYDAERGPISYALMPMLVSDALNRHVGQPQKRDRRYRDGSKDAFDKIEGKVRRSLTVDSTTLRLRGMLPIGEFP